MPRREGWCTKNVIWMIQVREEKRGWRKEDKIMTHVSQAIWLRIMRVGLGTDCRGP